MMAKNMKSGIMSKSRKVTSRRFFKFIELYLLEGEKRKDQSSR